MNAKFWKLSGKDHGRPVRFYFGTCDRVLAEDAEAGDGSFISYGRFQARNMSLAEETAFVQGIAGYLITSNRSIAIEQIQQVSEIPPALTTESFESIVGSGRFSILLQSERPDCPP